MSTWTEEQLRDAVSKKGNLKATTDIICKFFLDAVSHHRVLSCPESSPCLGDFHRSSRKSTDGSGECFRHVQQKVSRPRLTSLEQLRGAQGVPERTDVHVPTRAAARLCPQESEEKDRGRCAPEPDLARRVPRSVRFFCSCSSSSSLSLSLPPRSFLRSVPT
mgnify:CR=1 FL=1